MRMRRWSLILLLLGCASCNVRVPYPRGVPGALNATVRANATVRVNATVHANATVVAPKPPELPPPPPPPEPAVALQGAPVVEFFGIPLEGAQDVVFVLDCSGSMTDPAQGAIAQINTQGSPQSSPQDSPPDSPEASPAAGSRKIDVARGELIDALQRLPAGTLMDVIFFNSGVEAFAPTMVPLEETGRDGLISFVKEMDAIGSTALVPAMRIAFLMNARRIVLLSDGMGNVGGDSSDLLREAREAMRGGVRIDTIGLGQQQDAALLQTLARESGGIYQPL